MKKILFTILLLCAMCTSASAFDIFASQEVQIYNDNHYKWMESIVEVGQDIKYARIFASAQYDHDNSIDGYTPLFTVFRAGVGKNLGPFNLAGGYALYQTYMAGAHDNNGIFVRLTYSYNSESK